MKEIEDNPPTEPSTQSEGPGAKGSTGGTVESGNPGTPPYTIPKPVQPSGPDMAAAGKQILGEGVNKLRRSVPAVQPFEAKLARWSKTLLAYLIKPCRPSWGLALLSAIVLVFFYNGLIAPGVLFASFMAHDNVIFIDGVHRVWDGCVPHLDFVTGLGFLNFVGPALAQPFTDSEVMALLYYQYAWVALAIGFSLYLGLTRLHNASTIVLLVYTAAIVGAPSNIGDSRYLITMAMFYNRYGWALLTFAFLLLLPRRQSQRLPKSMLDVADASMLASIVFLAAYTKITYLVAIGGMCVLAAILYRREFLARFSLAAGIFLAAALALEWHWPGMHIAYLADLKQLSDASNGAKFNVLSGLFDLPREVVFAILAFVLLRQVYTVKRSYTYWKHVALAVYLAAMTVFILLNNAQNAGLPSMIAILISALTLLLVNIDQLPKSRRTWAKVGMLALLAFYFFPEANERLATTERHGRKADRVVYAFDAAPGLERYVISEGDHNLLEAMNPEHQEENGVNIIREIRDASRRLPPLQEIYQTEYAYMISQGANALASVIDEHGKGGVVNFDFANPFSTLLDLPSVRSEYAWYHGFRNITDEVHLEAAQVLGDAKYVTIPLYSTVRDTTEMLQRLYKPYMEEHFELVHKDYYWEIWMRTDAELAE